MKPNNTDPKTYTQEPTVQTEIIENIPVKNQMSGSQAPTTEGINPVNHPAQVSLPADDKNLDNILKDVNQNVKNPAAEPVVRFPKATGGSNIGRLVPIVAAFMIATFLSIAAFYAYSKPANPSSSDKTNSPQTHTAVTRGDINSLTSSVESTLGGSGSQVNLDANSLDDSTLGL